MATATKQHKIESLTATDQRALEAARSEWLRHGLAAEPADRPRAEAAVRDLYAVVGLKEPMIIWMDSPLGGVWAAAWFEELSKNGDVRAQVWDQVWAQVGDQVWDQVRAQVRDQVRAQVRAQVGAAVWGQHEAGWLAWANVMREIGVKYDKRTNGALDALSCIGNSSGWWWPREGVAILTERPTVLHRDPAPANRLHCEDGPAILYPDGWGIWAWHGIRVEQEIIEDPKALNVKRITDEDNAELRRAYMEIYGTVKYMAEAGGEMLDKVHEPLFPGMIDAELWRMPNPDGGEPFVCVKCRNSTPEPDGSYKHYHLWVHPECRPLLPENEHGEPQFGEPQELTAHNALASTWGETGANYEPIVET